VRLNRAAGSTTTVVKGDSMIAGPARGGPGGNADQDRIGVSTDPAFAK
jgi:hypothetical protein